jgi:hypothetical protein
MVVAVAGVNRRQVNVGANHRKEVRVMCSLSRGTLILVLIVPVLVVGRLPAALAQTPETSRGDVSALTGAELVELAQELQKEVEELRGWKYKRRVKAELYSAEQLRRFVEKKAFEEEYGPDGLPRVQAFLRMVGLIPADCDLRQTIVEVLLNQAGGFYDPQTETFHMLERPDVDYGPLVNRIIIAHELTHALDDQHFDLDRLIKSRERTEDWAFTIGAVFEGSASVLMMRYATRAMQSGQYDGAQLAEVARQEQERSRMFMEAPPYFASLVSMYVGGMYFLLAEEGGEALTGLGQMRNVGPRVLQAAKDPPVSTEQILHPHKYWDKAQRDHPVVVDDADVERLLRRAGSHIVHRDTVGELLCAVLTTDENRVLNLMLAALPTYWTNEAATGWGGDRFFLLAQGPDRAAARKTLRGLKGVWITLWDTRDDRDEFVEDYELERELPARYVFKLGARGAVFLFGFDGAERAGLQRRFQVRPPAFTRNGRPWTPSDN